MATIVDEGLGLGCEERGIGRIADHFATEPSHCPADSHIRAEGCEMAAYIREDPRQLSERAFIMTERPVAQCSGEVVCSDGMEDLRVVRDRH